MSNDKNHPLEIYLTVDYEIYFGRSLMSQEAILIAPTKELLACCGSLGVPLTMFCDVNYIFRCREWGDDSFVELVEKQLCDAVRSGHDVQLHIHPHWQFTKRDNTGRFHFDDKHYLLGTIFNNPDTRKHEISQMVAKGKQYLENLLKPVDANYKCCAYRAGGYGLQPHEKDMLSALIENGIKLDSSVIPGYKMQSKVHKIDFSGLMGIAHNWFGPKYGLAAPATSDNGLLEIPIASANLQQTNWNPWPEGLRRVLQQLINGGPPSSPRGEPVGWVVPAKTPIMQRARRSWWDLHAVLNARDAKLEMYRDTQRMLAITNGHIEREAALNGVHRLAVIGHPKGMDISHLKALQGYVQNIRKSHKSDVRFLSMSDLARTL
ncbi:MAG: hypothetical protein HQL71_05845 [Magnetococcales bacterium]|nr:hypothetical protein [Magnetococcales bacterium]